MNFALAASIVLAGWIAHPESMSSSRVVVNERSAQVSLRCQALSLLEAIPGLDANGDGKLEQSEIEAGRLDIGSYVAAHYQLNANPDDSGAGGESLQASFLAAQRTELDTSLPERMRRETVDIELIYRSTVDLKRLAVEVTLFREANPDHVDIASVEWPSGVSHSFGIDRHQPRAVSDPSHGGVLSTFFRRGLEHIAGGLDHLAFVAALVLASRSIRSLLWLVTAFTLAHSITLALATLGIIDLSRYSSTIEATIALSIAYVAFETALAPDERRGRWPEALLFGLIHGLGFAGFLAESLVAEGSRAVALVAFNLGVEAGQLALVSVLVVLLAGVRRLAHDPGEFLAPRWLRRAGSAVIGVMGLVWFAQRVF